MKLTLWTYEGPPHVGAMRIATAMEKVHYVLHAPQGDTYADLLFTMIELESIKFLSLFVSIILSSFSQNL
jgi:light-independent protochlorophyllide reductase subunit B